MRESSPSAPTPRDTSQKTRAPSLSNGLTLQGICEASNSFARRARRELREPSGPDGHPNPGEPSSPITAVGPKSFASVRGVAPATARALVALWVRKPRATFRFRRPSADSRGAGVRVTRTERLTPPWRTHPFPLGLAPSRHFDTRSSGDTTTTGQAPQGQDHVEPSAAGRRGPDFRGTRHRSQPRSAAVDRGFSSPARFSCVSSLADRRWHGRPQGEPSDVDGQRSTASPGRCASRTGPA